MATNRGWIEFEIVETEIRITARMQVCYSKGDDGERGLLSVDIWTG
jgi:hypothetical protein